MFENSKRELQAMDYQVDTDKSGILLMTPEIGAPIEEEPMVFEEIAVDPKDLESILNNKEGIAGTEVHSVMLATNAEELKKESKGTEPLKRPRRASRKSTPTKIENHVLTLVDGKLVSLPQSQVLKG